MKWLFSFHKATQRFLTSQGYHLHGNLFRHASTNLIRWSNLDNIQPPSLYSCQYSSSTTLNATQSEYCRKLNSFKIENNVKKVDLEIISRGTIKPSSPTPHHLRNFKLSILDQVLYDVYTPLITFLPNTDKASFKDVINKRSDHLKETLSITLARFYPFAGKVRDHFQIECNDEGIYYTEALVNQALHDFLAHPDDERMRGLMPAKPCTEESSIGNYVIGIQVNIFKCGGIGLSTTMSHKIIDRHTYDMFMKAWATTASGLGETLSPSFIASEIFPNNPSLEYSLPSKLLATSTLSTKRFVFDSKALASLKAQMVISNSTIHTHPPTRVEATSAVLWKAAALAASKVRPFGPQSPHALVSIVDLRKRTLPHLPSELIGNLIVPTGAICFPVGGDLDLSTLVGKVRESIVKINSDKLESMKGEKGYEAFKEFLRSLNQLEDVTVEGDSLLVTSQLNSGIYEIDFGWGKPIWHYIMNARTSRRVSLTDMLKGGGVEAVVSLSPDEMDIFECDLELLSYATLNPSPLCLVE